MMNRPPYIYVHADDYGMTPQTCERIRDCWEHGCLNSISLVPNGCRDYAEQCRGDARIPCAIHLNLVEGKGLMPADQIDLLVREDGYMKNSFLGLLLLSLSPKRKKLKEQLYLEIREQLLTTLEYFGGGEPIFLDSHQHTHMIPLIFRTLLQVVEECEIPVHYLRIPAEPITPFLLEPSLYPSYSLINLVKNGVLNFLWLFNRRKFRASGISSALFCGIIMSGNMDESRVNKIFPHFYKMAEKRNCNLEFLFHPGYMRKGEKFMDPYKASFHRFYISKGRKAEFDMLHREKWCELVRKSNKKAYQFLSEDLDTAASGFACPQPPD